MQILTYIPVWKRQGITRLCYDSLIRTYENAPENLSFQTVIVASNESDAKLAEEYGFDVTYQDNLPLGKKFNKGLEHALIDHDWDYLFQLNSDDVLSIDFWKIINPYIEKKMFFFGVDCVYFYNSETKDMREFQYSMGCGIRFIRRDIVEQAGFIEKGNEMVFELWDNHINAGLDLNSGDSIMKRANKMQYMVRDKSVTRPVVVDIKSKTNIHPFSEFRSAKRLTEAHRRQVMKRFPELNVLDSMMDKRA